MRSRPAAGRCLLGDETRRSVRASDVRLLGRGPSAGRSRRGLQRGGEGRSAAAGRRELLLLVEHRQLPDAHSDLRPLRRQVELRVATRRRPEGAEKWE